MPYKPHEVLLNYLDSLLDTATDRPVLDLACGAGRSGLILASKNIPVLFADRSETALKSINQALLHNQLAGRTWQTDLEQPEINPFTTGFSVPLYVFDICIGRFSPT